LASLEGFTGGRVTPSEGWPLTPLPADLPAVPDKYSSVTVINI